MRGLTKLQRLSLIGTKIEGLELQSLPASITDLDLNVSEITDRGVAGIAKRTSLETLRLERTRITDAAIDDLAKMTSLRRLYLRETAICDAGSARLQQALPCCEIVARRTRQNGRQVKPLVVRRGNTPGSEEPTT